MRAGHGLPRASRWLRPALLAAAFAVPGCRYHLGTPPVAFGLAVGEIAAPVPEAGLPEAIGEALAAAIRRRGAAGDRLVEGQVTRASFEPAAARDGGVQAWTATLGVRFVLLGPAPRTLELAREAAVGTPDGSSAGLANARAAAFAGLARDLAEEAVDAFLWAPLEAAAATGGVP